MAKNPFSAEFYATKRTATYKKPQKHPLEETIPIHLTNQNSEAIPTTFQHQKNPSSEKYFPKQ